MPSSSGHLVTGRWERRSGGPQPAWNRLLRHEVEKGRQGIEATRRGRIGRPSAVRDSGALVEQAVARAKEGDASALHFLYVRYAESVCGYINSIVRDSHEAEDLTHDVFAKLTRAILKYEQREVPFGAWILRVSRNAAFDHLRTRRPLPAEEVRRTDESHEAGWERAQSLRAALESLSDDQRKVLILRHVAGLSPGEIANRLGKTEASIHGLHHRARRSLQAALRELDAEPVTKGGS
jgi:RNA polymerase sigma-70 factor, ECF subfamily